MPASRILQYQKIELEYDAPLGATLKFFTDLPGHVLALRKTVALPATASRRAYPIPLHPVPHDGTYPEGPTFRVRVEPNGATESDTVRLYGGRIFLRPLGVYIEGAAGEIWETLDISPTI